MSVQAQWSLDSTSGSLLSMSRGLVEAATSDNVEPLAIIAAERFGSTLTVCLETRRKIEQLVLPAPKPAMIKYLQLQLGFSANDCAAARGRSRAGVQFLALAAALVSVGRSEASTVLDQLLAKTATDKTSVPSIGHLQQLLKSLEGRCQHSGFAASIMGWEYALNSHPEATRVPPAGAIVKLIELFQELEQDESKILTITTDDCIPWTAAFTKWCLGRPPSIYSKPGLPVPLVQQDSRVTIIGSRNRDFKVTLATLTIHLVDYAFSESTRKWNGLVPVKDLFRRKLQLAGYIHENTLYSLGVFIPLALERLRSAICTLHMRSAESSSRYSLSDPLPIPQSVEKLFKELISRKHWMDITETKELAGEQGDLLSLFAKSLKLDPMDDMVNRYQPVTIFLDVLAISIYLNHDSVLVSNYSPDKLYSDTGKTIVDILRGLLTSNAKIQEIPLGLLHHALRLVDDDGFDQPRRTPLIFSHKGQVIYPDILATHHRKRQNFFSLTCLRGELRYNGQIITEVKSELKKALTQPSPFPQAVTVPKHLLGIQRLTWEVEQVYETLIATPTITTVPGNVVARVGSVDLMASILWPHIYQPKYNGSCPHSSSEPLLHPVIKSNSNVTHPGGGDGSLRCFYSTAESPLRPLKHCDISVVAVDGADDLRLFTIMRLYELGEPAVLRESSCLSCCVAFCQEAGVRVIIC